jgi:hypothetical protein
MSSDANARLRSAARRARSNQVASANGDNPEESDYSGSKIGVLLSGVPKSAIYELKKRGFVPKYSFQKGCESTITLVMVISPKLFMKLVIESNYPIKTQGASSLYHVTRVYAMSLAIINRMKLKSKSCFVVHDTDALKELHKGLQLNPVNDYFGSSIALYFGWLQFYTNYLYIPAIAGILLFCHQYYTGKVCPIILSVLKCADRRAAHLHVLQADSMWVPCFMVLLTVWGEMFLAMWDRRNVELTFAWGVMDQDELHMSKELAKEVTPRLSVYLAVYRP